MNDYLTSKMYEMRLQDSARRQRNADHLAELARSDDSRRKRFLVWIMRRFSSRRLTVVERARRDCPPPCLTSRPMSTQME